MKKLLIALVALLPLGVLAASGPKIEPSGIDWTEQLQDKESLRRGAELFQNYCAGCHSTQYQRYQRVAEDLDIPVDEMRKLIHTDAKIGELMENAIETKDAAKWFGAAPPDLTLVARVRGDDWVYSYLKGFYKDPSRPFGVNNTVFPSVGMPHVLEELQGMPVKQEDGSITVSGGSLSAEEYDQVVRDLTGFLVYSAEPVKLERENLGKWVLGFLFIFFVIAYLLKKEYWKDVH
ncbi:cytochrome c1 [Shewanella algae]|uniref:cytochrome c1 n=1 Tax=Shewanella algae TaxID=38313 RepID=UPI0011820712|nr:cytochrome c1 [Shewanella algae]MBC8794475.1 cytochrome c1 [Shewanella algae]QHD52583.1 cytochrome c1 [Shewanella algae]TVL56411.1 cytochrome C [Shewanella algae]